ncbi:MAG: alpha/beta fold hydrolase [Ktedonobacteraceae bacterium]
MKYVIDRLVGSARFLARLLGLGVLGSVALAGLVAFRHMLATPQPLDSPLPGEAHLYRWTHGHIYYKVAGEQDAPPLALVHTPELAGSAFEMLGIMASLATSYRVYALDLLGFGLSDRPDISYTSDLYTQLLHDFLTNVVTEPATLVASRLACNYAATVAANSPELCSRLVLLSPTALHGYQAGMFGLPAVLPNVPRARIIMKQAQALLYPLLVETGRLARRLRYGQPERMIMRSLTSSQSNPSPDYKYATTHQFGAEHAPMDWLAGNLSSDVSDAMEKLRQPTLIIWGTGALQHAQYERGLETSRSFGLDDEEMSGDTTRMILLQRTASAVHEELPETVCATILKWSAERAIAQTNTVGARSIASADEARMPDVTINADNGTTRPRIKAYCMKCKEKRAILNAHEVTMKNGRIAVQGDCEVCGTSLFRMGRLIPGYPQTPI